MAGATSSERELPLVRLPRGPIRGLAGSLQSAIRGFSPLDFEPGRRAADWLRVNTETGILPLDTYLVLDETSSELLGFFVLEPAEVRVAPGDFPVIQVRTRLGDSERRVKAMKLVWIVRSATSPEGFGEDLFNEALARALEFGAVAVLVEPYDRETADRLWVRHFHCRQQRRNSEFPDEWGGHYWYPLGLPDQTWG